MKWLSRKLILTAVGVLCTIVLMATGALDPLAGAKLIAAQVGTYVGIEGIRDMITAGKKK